MTKDEILDKWNRHDFAELGERVNNRITTFSATYSSMDEYAEQEAVGFFLWYAIKMMSFIEYIQDIRPRVESHGMEQKIEEFEGKPIKDLYKLYIQDKNKTP